MLKNVKVSVKGKQLTIVVDLSKRLGTSKSGKSEIVATTAGNIPVADGVMLGLNCYVPATR
jgi:hypothetical protein